MLIFVVVLNYKNMNRQEFCQIIADIRKQSMKELKKDIPYLQYMTDSRSGEKIIVPESSLLQFYP